VNHCKPFIVMVGHSASGMQHTKRSSFRSEDGLDWWM